MTHRPVILFIGCALLIGATSAPTPPADPKTTKGPQCLNLSQLDHSEVVDDKTILFHMKGGKIWRNDLPFGCPRLGYEKAFSHKTTINQICTVDIITVLNNYGGSGLQEEASCGLGDFTAYIPPPKDKAVK